MNILEIIGKEGIVAVLRADSPERCVRLAEEIYEGGIKIIEITFTVPEADKVISKVAEKLQDAIVGAGTVLSVKDCEKAIKAGARFIVSPHLSEEIAKISNVPYIPGIMTPTEYVKAKELGCEVVKIFPGSVLKPTFIKSMRGPFPEFKAIPTGGVSLDNLEEWFSAGAFAVGVGSNLTKKGNPKENAKLFIEKIRRCRK